MLRPSPRAVTRPTSLRTRRCLETLGCSKPSAVTMSPTGRSCRARKERIARRRGSATALKASEVVEARGMGPIYTHIGICQENFLWLAPRHRCAPELRTQGWDEERFFTAQADRPARAGREEKIGSLRAE